MTRLLGVLVALSLFEPFKERLGRLAHLLTGRDIDVFLAGARAPFGDNVFAENVVVVEKHQDLGCRVVDIRVLLAAKSDESFDASKKGLFVFLRGDHL
jgi:hypothetical protein